MREEAVVAIREHAAPAGLTPEEAQIVDYVRALLRPPHRVTAAQFSALRDRLGVRPNNGVDRFHWRLRHACLLPQRVRSAQTGR